VNNEPLFDDDPGAIDITAKEIILQPFVTTTEQYDLTLQNNDLTEEKKYSKLIRLSF